MKDASATLIGWKNKPDQPDPLVTLYDVSLDDSTTLRLVEGDPSGTGSITYGGHTYTAAAIAREELTENIESEVPSFRVAVSNISGVAGGYIETYDLDGRSVTITRVPLSTLNSADALVEEYTIQEQSYNREKAIFVLGHANLFKRRVPSKQYVRTKCQHAYAQRFTNLDGCIYPSDLFAADTRQDLIPGSITDAEIARQFGWFTVNATKALVWDVDHTVGDAMYLETESLGIEWDEASHNAPFLYKKIIGDFDVIAQVEAFDTRISCQIGILCQEDGDSFDSWVFLGRTEVDDGSLALRVTSAEAAVAGVVILDSNQDDPYLRLKRVGNVFTTYRSADEGNWTQIDQRTVVLIPAVRLGLAIAAQNPEGGEVVAGFRYFRFLAGGLPTCDLTLDGLNGCEVHRNVHRMFAFPGIPRT